MCALPSSWAFSVFWKLRMYNTVASSGTFPSPFAMRSRRCRVPRTRPPPTSTRLVRWWHRSRQRRSTAWTSTERRWATLRRHRLRRVRSQCRPVCRSHTRCPLYVTQPFPVQVLHPARALSMAHPFTFLILFNFSILSTPALLFACISVLVAFPQSLHIFSQKLITDLSFLCSLNPLTGTVRKTRPKSSQHSITNLF